MVVSGFGFVVKGQRFGGRFRIFLAFCGATGQQFLAALDLLGILLLQLAQVGEILGDVVVELGGDAAAHLADFFDGLIGGIHGS